MLPNITKPIQVRMKKKLTLWILLLPALAFAQVQVKDGAITIDLGKKKNKTEQVDSTAQEEPSEETEEEEPVKVKKTKPAKAKEEEEEDPNFKRDGLFKAMFTAGLNLSQIDGDEQAGYTHPGAYVGVGAMVKFHKYLSVNTGIYYTMRGATKKADVNIQPMERFKINWDYVQVPIMFNVHDKKLVMASVGIGLNYMVRNQITHQVDSFGQGLVEYSQSGLKTPAPKRFDLTGIAGFQFFIKRVIGIGASFEYSFLKLRPSYGANTRVKNMFNNTITIKLTYILDPVQLKAQRNKRASGG